MGSTKPCILIVGAGIGGLGLAQRRGVDFVVFERDRFLDSRGQGYRLKIPADTASKLHQLVTNEAWKELQATEAETLLGETTVNACDGGLLARRKTHMPNGVPRPLTLDRSMMRKASMTGIEENFCFGKTFLSFNANGTTVEVVFQDGTIERGNLLVGADGGRSQVKKQRAPELKVVDAQVCYVYGKTPLSVELLQRYLSQYRQWINVMSDRTPQLQEIIFGGSPVVLISEPVTFKRQSEREDLPHDFIHWGLLFPKSLLGMKDVELQQACRQNAVEISLTVTECWHDSMKPLLELQDCSQSSAMVITSVKPPIPTWSPISQVTLIGDAAHIMSPAGGVGAATALNDAWKLALTIAESGISSASVGAYEAYMRENAEAARERTYRADITLHNQRPYHECAEIG